MSTTAARSRSRRNDSGAILIIVMMVMLGLLGLGVTALWLTSGNLQMGANINQRTQALYVAEAGIERARAILNPPAPGLNAAQMTALLTGNVAQGGNNNAPTGVDAATGNPNGVGVIIYDGATPLIDVGYPAGRGPSTDPGAPPLMGRYSVWIRNDTAEIRRGCTAGPGGGCTTALTVDNNTSVIVRSRGMAVDNRTNVVLEVALGANLGAPDSPAPIPPPPVVLCNAGKNACDDNNSTIAGVVAN